MWMSLGVRLVAAAELETPFPVSLDMLFLASRGLANMTDLRLSGTVITTRSITGNEAPIRDSHNQDTIRSQSRLLLLEELTMTVPAPVLPQNTPQRHSS